MEDSCIQDTAVAVPDETLFHIHYTRPMPIPAPIRTVAVTGGTGFVGRYVIRELLACGYQVRALIRDRAKAREIFGPDIGKLQLITGDILDGVGGSGKADELVRGSDAVIHLIGIIRENRSDPKNPQTFLRMHIEATRAIVKAAEAAGVKRYVHMSALGVGNVAIDPVPEYQRTKWEAERLVQDSTLNWTIFRPGLIHGLGSLFIDMAEGWATGLTPPYLFLPYFTRGEEDKTSPLGAHTQVDPRIAPVAVEDVAKAFVGSLANPTTIHEIYNLVGSETLTYPQLLSKVRDGVPGTNHAIKPFGIPGDAAAIGAKVASMLGLGSLLPFDEGMARMSTQDVTSETAKVKAHLGFQPRGFTETFGKYASRV
jgi:NADH dehydrogenase